MERIFVGFRRHRVAWATTGLAALALLVVLAVVILRPSDSGVLPLAPTPFEQGEFLVKFKPGAPGDDIRNFHAAQNAPEIETIPQIGVSRRRVPDGFSVQQMVEAYRRNPNIDFAEPNFLRSVASTPNDGYITLQWAVTKTSLPAAWDLSTGNSAVTIAILDTGIAATHEDLSGRAVGSPPLDDNGHGTAVAGIAGAASNNVIGVAGVCWQCRILAIKVLNSSGNGADSGISSGIIQATDQGASVISMSFGGYSVSSTMQSAVDYAASHGVVLIGASGNDGSTSPFYPAAYTNVLAVGASDSNDNRMTTSNYGSWLGVVAPGLAILSTTRDGAYEYQSGTSIAAPHVAGLAGLLRSVNPGLSNQQVANFIKNSATDLGPAGRDDQFGFGRINAAAALQQATGGGGPTPTTLTTATPTRTSTPTTTTVGSSSPTIVQANTSTTVPATSTPTMTPQPPTATRTPTRSSTPTSTQAPPTATTTPTPTTTGGVRTETLTGRVDERRGPAQVTHAVSVAAPGTISANVTWGGGANLNLALIGPTGQQVASAQTNGKPETLTFNATAVGTYTLQVTSVSGAANYTLTTTHP